MQMMVNLIVHFINDRFYEGHLIDTTLDDNENIWYLLILI